MSDNFETFIDGGLGPNRKLSFDKLNDIIEKIDRLYPFIESNFLANNSKHVERTFPILCFAQESQNQRDGKKLYDWFEAHYVGGSAGVGLSMVPEDWNGYLNSLTTYGGVSGTAANNSQAILLGDFIEFGQQDNPPTGPVRSRTNQGINRKLVEYRPQRKNRKNDLTANYRGAESEEDPPPIYLYNVQQMNTVDGGRQHVLVAAAYEGFEETCFKIIDAGEEESNYSWTDEDGQPREIPAWRYTGRRFPERDGDEVQLLYDLGYDKFCSNTPTGVNDATFEYKPYAVGTIVTALYDDRSSVFTITAPIGNARVSCNPNNPLECGI